MSSLHGVPVSDVVFGNGWAPGSTRRVVVKAADESWNISRNDSSAASLALAHADNGECIVMSSSGEVLYDLRPLARSNWEYRVDGLESEFTFTLRICDNSTQHHPIAHWQRGGDSGALGTVGGKPRKRGNKLLVEYADGDACPGAAQRNRSALISFICEAHADSEYGQPEFVAEWNQCEFMFEWRTPLACASRKLASEESNGEQSGRAGEGNGASRGSVAFVVIFVVGSVYILGGFLYNRVFNLSSGLRGIEQLPNYKFWRGIYLFSKRAVLLLADGATRLVDAVRGRRGAIHIDAAEHNIRNEIFASTADEGEGDALPFALR
ncbi:Cation-independent mannose-6-phosphate receptor CI-MPR [Coemansia aciculifera]|uniref:Cation-independent mannose-6-phosphate receptor CI-MPR n=1 Tax=Coemansia aciculifera TaxID=417176 RepID=A0A9W8INF4_9FUNG|nr:Cation-independent mannose-6-phosphate receptor CI-MPR [Coemansia aciculifera]